MTLCVARLAYQMIDFTGRIRLQTGTVPYTGKMQPAASGIEAAVCKASAALLVGFVRFHHGAASGSIITVHWFIRF